MSDVEGILAEFFNISFSLEEYTHILFLSAFLFLTVFLRFMFWRISPVIYEFALIGIFYGLGKLVHARDSNSTLEVASDLASRNILHLLTPIYVFTATFQFNTAFGSYPGMVLLLISLIPFFVVNLFFISWVMFSIFEKSMVIGFMEMLMITIILSPIQVQYVMDYLAQAQGCTTEFSFKMRAEQYSSIWLSFVISNILEQISSLSQAGKYSSLLVFLFILYQRQFSAALVVHSGASNLPNAALRTSSEVSYYAVAVSCVTLTISLPFWFIILCVDSKTLQSPCHMGLLFYWTYLQKAVILSPVQVQYIVDYLNRAQGCTAEFLFKMRGEQYSSISFSFMVATILDKIVFSSKMGQYRRFVLVMFILYQLLGIIIGIIFARLVTYPLKSAGEMSPIYTVSITVVGVYLVQLLCVLLGTSHTLAIGLFGIAVNAQVSRSSREIVEFFEAYWIHLLFLINSLTVAFVGVVLGYAEHDISSLAIRIVIIFYCVFAAVRMILLFIAFPLVTIAIGRTVDWRYAIIQVVGTYKGGPTYILGFQYAMLTTRNWYTVLQITVLFTMVSQIFNVLMFPLLLRMLRMYDYSAARIANMNIAMADTNNCREKAIFALKMDKVFRDANWPMVEAITRLSHPYKKTMSDSVRSDEGREEHQIRSVICPDCKTEILAQPTKREIEAMKREARERILKSQQVSFHRQYEMGSLTVREYDYLSSFAEAEIGMPEPRLNPERMKFRSNFTKLLIQLKRLLLWFSRLTAEVYNYVPQSTIRNWCYQISTARQLRIIMALLTLLDTVITIAQVIIYYSAPEGKSGDRSGYSSADWNYAMVVQKIHIFFYALSLIEFTVLLLGLGIDQYFSRNVNKIEAATGIILGTLEIGIYTENCVVEGKTLHPFVIPVLMLIKSTTPLRLAKIYILITAAVPKIIASIDATLADEMMRNYELGKAYLVALNRTSTLLNRIVYSESVYTELMKEIDADRLYVTREMGLIQKENPSIATTVKTRHAIRYVINAMEDCIKDMKEEGVIDMIEAEAVQDSLAKNKNTLRELLMISATPPEDILKNIPWLKDDQDNLKFLLRNAELTSYDYGDILIHAGDDPVGIHLLVSGLLRSHYIPSTTTLQLSAKFGVLPNYDFFNNVKFDQPQETYVVSGSIIGEIGAVSGRRYDMTISCDTAVQVYYIPWDVVKQVVHESKESLSIMSKIWKSISVRIAMNILQYNIVSFQGWAPEKLLMYLHKGFVPVIMDLIAVVVSTKVEIIILIEGVVMDKTSRKIYTAPDYIHKNIHEIILPEHPDWEYSTICETRMLIIPSSMSNEEELRGPSGIFKYREKEKNKDDPDSAHRKVGFDVEAKEIIKT